MMNIIIDGSELNKKHSRLEIGVRSFQNDRERMINGSMHHRQRIGDYRSDYLVTKEVGSFQYIRKARDVKVSTFFQLTRENTPHCFGSENGALCFVGGLVCSRGEKCSSFERKTGIFGWFL